MTKNISFREALAPGVIPHSDLSRSITMYDFYPEWGPARNRDQDAPQPVTRRPRYWTAGGAEVRDGDLQRPDDN